MLKVTSIRSLVAALALVPVAAIAQAPPDDPFTKAYADNCAACHGANLEGSAQGVPLAGADLRHGDSVDQIAKSIAEGFPQQDRMPAFGATMDEATIRRLAIFVSEKRHELAYTDFKVSALPTIPEGPIKSEKQTFRVETFATGLDPLPYSMAALPDGSFLVTEKTRGLRMISADGRVSDLIRNTPKAYHDGFEVPGDGHAGARSYS